MFQGFLIFFITDVTQRQISLFTCPQHCALIDERITRKVVRRGRQTDNQAEQCALPPFLIV